MNITTCLAAVTVADLDEAKQFYTELLGRAPDLEPMPTLAQWDFANASALQIVDHPETAGAAMATIMVSDFDGTVATLRRRRLPVGEIIHGDLSRLVQVHDPAGNTLTLVESNPH